MEEVKKTLESKLERRPSKEDLTSRNIIAGGGKDPIVAENAAKLEKAQAADKVKKLMENRPTKDDLENQGIIKGGNVAPALAEAAVALEPKLAQAQLKQHLAEDREHQVKASA
eukprot:CFRG8358T1